MYLPYKISSCNMSDEPFSKKLYSVCRNKTLGSTFNIDTIYENHSLYEQTLPVAIAYDGGQTTYSSATTMAIHIMNRDFTLHRNNRIKACLWGCLIPVDVYQKL